MLKKLGTAAVVLLVGLAGGLTFYLLHFPLPWTLGSLFTAALLSIYRERWSMPSEARTLALPVVGVLAGSAFTPTVLATAMQWWDAILAVIGFLLVTSAFGNAYFRVVGKLDRTTAFFASVPGGLAEMTLLGGTLGGDMRRLVIVHIVRILVTVVSVPLILQVQLGQPVGRLSIFAPNSASVSLQDIVILALCAVVGVGLSRLLRFPSGTMVFTLILSAAAHISGLTGTVLPPWVSALMQVIVGSVAGAHFAGLRLREIGNTLALASLWACGMVLFATTLAWTICSWFGRSFEAMLLALAPGGIVEMTTMAIAVGIEVAFVVSCQVCRILLVLLLMPPVYHLLTRVTARPFE